MKKKLFRQSIYELYMKIMYKIITYWTKVMTRIPGFQAEKVAEKHKKFTNFLKKYFVSSIFCNEAKLALADKVC